MQDIYQNYIHKSRYARYLPNKNKRETWEETVARYCNFWWKRNNLFPLKEIQEYILEKKVMPSMRALMTAGEALEKDHMAGFNCSF